MKLVTIHEFAQICRTTPRTLRFYEQKGLFKPQKIDTSNGYRLYEPTQAREFLKIKLLQNFHKPLNEIKPLLNKHKIKDYIAEQIQRNIQEIQDKQNELEFLQRIQNLLYLYQEGTPDIPLQEELYGPYILLCYRIENGSYHDIKKYIIRLWDVAQEYNIDCENSEITFYIESAYQPQRAELEIALISQATQIPTLRKPLPTHIYFKKYSPTKCLSYTYLGPYDYLTLVYQQLYKIIESKEITITGNVFEKYIFGSLNTRSPYNYKTMIAFPIK